MERDARYAAVALFALAAVAAAVAFVWWYSGQGDRRTYERYEIHFDGSVSGLAQGSPVRYLGVDVGRVEHLSVSRKDPGRVRVVAEVDSEAPLSGATRARLGLLGLTGLLYIDLQLDPEANAAAPLARRRKDMPLIPARKGDIEAFLEKLPDLVGHAGAVMVRIESLLGDENLASVSDSLRNLREASAELPAISRDTAALAAELRRTVGGGHDAGSAHAVDRVELAAGTRSVARQRACRRGEARTNRREPRAHRGRQRSGARRLRGQRRRGPAAAGRRRPGSERRGPCARAHAARPACEPVA